MSVTNLTRLWLLLLMNTSGSVAAVNRDVSPDSLQGGFELTRHTIDAGGGRSSGGGFSLVGSIAQPDAEPLHPATGGSWEIVGGFQPRSLPAQANSLFANSFE